MAAQIPICLVTGFLGAGKTTLLKQIIARNADKSIVYLVNEFSPRDIDGAIVASQTPDVITIPGGSIFCKCLVTTFISQLREIHAQHASIDGVVIEASGMANPKVIHTMLAETHLTHLYRIARIVTVVDPGSFHKLRHTLPGIKDQIATADLALINKCDLFDAATLATTTAAIHELQPAITVQTVSHCEATFALFPGPTKIRPPTDTQQHEYALCRDPNYRTREISPVAPLAPAMLQQLLASIADDLYRLKGYITWEQQCYQVDWTTAGFHAVPIAQKKDPTLVCIHRGAPSAAVEEIMMQLQA